MFKCTPLTKEQRFVRDNRFDGDTGSFIALYTAEAIKEIKQAMRRAVFYKNPKGGLMASPYMETVQRTVYGLMSR